MKDLTIEQLARFNSPNATCHICDKIILLTDVKVRDHDHLTGEFRGPAHN